MSGADTVVEDVSGMLFEERICEHFVVEGTICGIVVVAVTICGEVVVAETICEKYDCGRRNS